MNEMTQREFLFDDREKPAEPTATDIEKMARKDVSHLIWHGDGAAVLAFATAMGIRPQIEAAMNAYNAGVVSNPMIIPFRCAEEFVVDPGVRASIAGTYNDKYSGRSDSYAEALSTRSMHPQKPAMRRMGEAFRHAVASRLRQ